MKRRTSILTEVLLPVSAAVLMIGFFYFCGYYDATRDCRSQNLQVINLTRTYHLRPIGPQQTSQQIADARRYNDALMIIRQGSS